MENQENNPQIKRKKRKRKKSFGLFYLFAFVFVGALFFITNLIKSYSPDIDVSIGSNENLTLSDSDMDTDVKPVDERLKWIQMEDDMPTVSVKEDEISKDSIKDFDDIGSAEVNVPADKNVIQNPPKPKFDEIKSNKPQITDSVQPPKQVIPLPKPAWTKVYLGNYSSIDEAMSVQNKISNDNPNLMPFVKSVKGTYIVQLGSFSDSDKAAELINNLKNQGYSPKTIVEN